MKNLNMSEHEARLEGARILAQDRYGVKVLESTDGNIIKLFRRKRLVSSAVFIPRAFRFVRNAKRLRNMGFQTVEILDVYRVPALGRDVVLYKKLPGVTLRDIHDNVHQGEQPSDSLMMAVAELLAELHRAGFLFRSVHFGNIVQTPDGALGLIDVSDLRRWGFRSLPVIWRIRNFGHIWRYPEDRRILEAWGVDQFVSTYLAHSDLDGGARKRFALGIRRRFLGPS